MQYCGQNVSKWLIEISWLESKKHSWVHMHVFWCHRNSCEVGGHRWSVGVTGNHGMACFGPGFLCPGISRTRSASIFTLKKTRAFWSKCRQDFRPISSWYRRTLHRSCNAFFSTALEVIPEGWPGITSKAVGKKSDTPLPTTLLNWLTDFLIVYVCMCIYVCTYHWAPGRVAFRLKAAPVKIRIFILYPLS